MNLKVILIGTALTFGLIFGGLFLLSRPPAAAPTVATTATGKLTVGETSYNFGTVSMAKGVVTKKFTITNSDTAPATVTKMFSSCMCTKAALQVGDKTWGPFGMPGHSAIPTIAAEVAPGQEAVVEVIFDPAAHGPAGVGQIARQVTLELNGQSPLTLNIAATVTP